MCPALAMTLTYIPESLSSCLLLCFDGYLTVNSGSSKWLSGMIWLFRKRNCFDTACDYPESNMIEHRNKWCLSEPCVYVHGFRPSLLYILSEHNSTRAHLLQRACTNHWILLSKPVVRLPSGGGLRVRKGSDGAAAAVQCGFHPGGHAHRHRCLIDSYHKYLTYSKV